MRNLSLLFSRNKFSITDMCISPHLPILVTLDTVLQASTALFEFQYPEIKEKNHHEKFEEHTVRRLLILSECLRKELLQYYLILQKDY